MTSQPAIWTASWFTPLPPNICRIGISRGVPRGHPGGYRRYPRLYPGPWLNAPTDEFIRRYEHEILAVLDPQQFVRDLARIAESREIALLCFERCGTADGWCHRGLVAQHMERELGLAVYEHGFAHLGSGSNHPMLPTT